MCLKTGLVCELLALDNGLLSSRVRSSGNRNLKKKLLKKCQKKYKETRGVKWSEFIRTVQFKVT